jgi:hypothetical protein
MASFTLSQSGRSHARAVVCALALTAGAACAGPALAQPADRNTERASPYWVIDRLDARIAQLKADLRLTQEQNARWDAFRKALIDAASARLPRVADQQRPLAQEQTQKDKTQQDRTPQEGKPQEPSQTSAAGAPARGPETTQATSPQQAPQSRLDRYVPRIDDDDADDERARDDRRGAQERSPADWRRRDEPARRDARARDDDFNALADMQDMATQMRERAEDLQKVIEAARPLYEILDRRQQRMLIRFIQREWMSGLSGMHGGAFSAREEESERRDRSRR